MDKFELEVADIGLLGILDICVVIWRLLELQKFIWDHVNGCGNIRERSTSFMGKSFANKAWILKEMDHEDKDVILSL